MVSLFVCVRVNVCQICAVQPLAFWELHHLLCCKSGARSVNELLVHTKHHLLFCNLQLYSLSFSCCVCGRHELRINQLQKPETHATHVMLKKCYGFPKQEHGWKINEGGEVLGAVKRAAAQSVCIRPPLVSFSPVAHQTAEPVCEHRLSPDITRYPVFVPLECVCVCVQTGPTGWATTAVDRHRICCICCPDICRLGRRHMLLSLSVCRLSHVQLYCWSERPDRCKEQQCKGIL